MSIFAQMGLAEKLRKSGVKKSMIKCPYCGSQMRHIKTEKEKQSHQIVLLMKKTKKQEIKSIDEFNLYLSLWNIISGGKQYGQIFLQKLIDQIQTDKFCNPTFKYPSILIHGKTGKKTFANAFLRSLCIEKTKHFPSLYFTTPSSCPQFFTDNKDAGYIISDVENLNTYIQNIIYTIIKYQKYINHLLSAPQPRRQGLLPASPN